MAVRWSDLDAYGHVNNARFLTLYEEARVAANRLVMLRPSNQGVCRAFELAGATEFLPLVDDVDQARKWLMAS